MNSAVRPRLYGIGMAATMLAVTAALTGATPARSTPSPTHPAPSASPEPDRRPDRDDRDKNRDRDRDGRHDQGEPSSKPADAAEQAGKADCRRVKCVALTFDDGPGPYTKTLLRHLAKYGARATFFVVGQNVGAYPDVVRRTAEAGHEIGNHTWSHPDLTKLSRAAIKSQLTRTDEAVESAAGVTPGLVRPPYGALDRDVRRQSHRPLVLWSVDTLDWRHRDSARVARVSLKRVRPGSVVLFHDIHPTTVKALPRVLKGLSARGYRFVTVSELFGGRPPELVYNAPARRLSGGPK
ncbi:polysaccharide deacetylase family protein [Nonomuraea sp. WAC 01424]|uniref:polysaccharide deacetylase family protein n=1 Tax=Nonomuraea sp. WAC 01424 TaxID=2203200 RepID=UPI0021AD806E|nr:polysaccharide deacetylase family protein [Nonomuraea sp. WAC 01424]